MESRRKDQSLTQTQTLYMRLPPLMTDNFISDLSVHSLFVVVFVCEALERCWITRLTKTTDNSSAASPTDIPLWTWCRLKLWHPYPISNIHRWVGGSHPKSVKVRVTNNSLRAEQPKRRTELNQTIKQRPDRGPDMLSTVIQASREEHLKHSTQTSQIKLTSKPELMSRACFKSTMYSKHRRFSSQR